MPSDDFAISVRNLTKTYRLFSHPGDRIKQFFSLGLKQYHREFTALNDISFDIAKGETVGIIGHNGSGKSTLLQVICGILKPTSGSVSVNGRVSALLELGAGFNPEFTGRENVYFQGAILGLTEADMDVRFDAIADFADIGEFIDQPVRTYSSGMFVRLAFSAASHIDPDVLVVDEVLAVGDAVYQQKCYDRIRYLMSRGTSILVVSHNPYEIERLCHRAAVMHHGRLSHLLPAKEILSLYHDTIQESLPPIASRGIAPRLGTHALNFDRVFLENGRGVSANSFTSLEPLRIVVEFHTSVPLDDVRFRLEVCSASNDVVVLIASNGLTESRRFHGKHRIEFKMSSCLLTSGWYTVDAIASGLDVRLDTWPRAAEFRVLLKDEAARNLSSDKGIFVCPGNWEFD